MEPTFDNLIQAHPILAKMPLTMSDCPKIICAILLPPVGVFFETGCSVHLAINILLTILGYIPGIIHALYIICAK
ncbi:proteolipid membrane potential modulator domain-containing protein [Ditylenchus destructor]|uniref:Proteolipid membrane potential modulator domain-containing protein n=1 Tax=Ditylenchus destructor TaxID=166010 RepID=A0AAD4R2C9_9BILA|nr:proteolipid membrane potential modulator domain-containing protein [Ditylenchus destructor]